ncbi:UNVERIFIED_CONTAM: seryl-tRNA synthetase [Siphonaria sp. JEL0065]|nr:seryl-tRNA synthetase [Siphonaria sp. JEL0065]
MRRFALRIGKRFNSSSAGSSSGLGARQFGPHLDYRGLKARIVSGEMGLNVSQRNLDLDVGAAAFLYDAKVALGFELDALRKQRNDVAAKVKATSKENKQDIQGLVKRGREIKESLATLEAKAAKLDADLYNTARHLPNDTCPSVPVGDESNAITLATINASLLNKEYKSPPQTHVDLCLLHDTADFNRASKVSGSGFYFLKNHGAMLEHALQRYAIETLTLYHGFTPISVPDVIRHEVLEACGFSPRSTDSQTYFLSTQLDASTDSFASVDPTRLCLAATAEFPLAAMHAGEVLSPKDLPKKYVGLGRAFRAEGLAGSINRGLYRVHQFSKVEMFALVAGGGSDNSTSALMLEEFRSIQHNLFEGLELCFRVLNMPTEELGAPAYKKYDMEAWMPGKNAWGEISSASNCTDYQSRRLNIRNLRPSSSSSNNTETGTQNLEFVHTVNGTAAAIPRLIIALLETHQQPNGDIYIPKKLQPFLYGGKVEVIKADETFQELIARIRN